MRKTTENLFKQLVTDTATNTELDTVICEQPLQINLVISGDGTENGSNAFVYTLTMRTPGDEQAHITGLLLSDGVITNKHQILSMQNDEDDNSQGNLWEVTLIASCKDKIKPINKYQTTYSSCGLCGNTSLKALELQGIPPLSNRRNWLSKKQIHQAGKLLFNVQPLQALTGGAHCAAMFDENSELIEIKEDIGRHNALDKLIGALAINNKVIRNDDCFLLISSRVSFEMVQKTLVAGSPILIALGAPSALAIQAAKRFDLTLIAFLKSDSFNVYHGDWRLRL
ncbi:formate dehydrogenase accessory sulfurtransferase FdhD [Thalassotalea profundi]|uniref:Sulfur carrier protein FdhD n=1 Tax=Thalassotalea profundi TaxID=2036687 RepID=A0ABQ3J1J1_9GAMM|nr:formate dehydrogenase accessory sulfurtransferase FdhD [Thalassotalea profundi]GHF01333.1 sulfurtransferase FdhD [Thalassotalea profundi]